MRTELSYMSLKKMTALFESRSKMGSRSLVSEIKNASQFTIQQ